MRGSLIYDHPGDFAATMRSPVAVLRPGRVLRACYPLAEAGLAFDGGPRRCPARPDPGQQLALRALQSRPGAMQL